VTPYPASLPLDAVQTIIDAIRDRTVVSDRANFAKAVWVLEGYALRSALGEPSSTPAPAPAPAPAPPKPIAPTPPVIQATSPLSDAEVLAHLETLVDPAFSFAEGPEGAAQALPAALALVPWRSILRWALEALAASL
jgi:hypothetical protein